MIGSDNKISQFLFSGLTSKGHEISYMHFNVSDVLPVQNLMENLIWSVVNRQPNRRNINQITMGLLFFTAFGSYRQAHSGRSRHRRGHGGYGGYDRNRAELSECQP